MAVIGSKSKDVKLKNYIILIGLFLLGGCLTLYLCKWYKVYEEYQKETPVIRDSLLEITADDLTHYIMENPSTIIYMCTANDDICRDYEKDFKKLVQKEGINEYVVYLNLTGINRDDFVNTINLNYNSKKKLTTVYPAFVVYEDGFITGILQGTNEEKLTVTKTKQFLELNKIGE